MEARSGAGSTRRLEVLVQGRVQGVFFRASAQEEALRLGLCGVVHNLPGGDVRAVFEGGEEALARMLAWCRVGPPGARVDRVLPTFGEATGEFDGFSVER